MVDEKKTVLIYKDALKDLDMLTEEQHSAYLMAFCRYVLEGEDTQFSDPGPGERNVGLTLAWRRMRDGIDINAIKYKRQVDANRENGGKGGRIPKSPMAAQEDIDRIIDAWNKLQDLGVEPVEELKDERLNQMNSAVEQYGADVIVDAITHVRRSDYLIGKVTGKPVKWKYLMEHASEIAAGARDTYHTVVTRSPPDNYGMQRDPQKNANVYDEIARMDAQRGTGEEEV